MHEYCNDVNDWLTVGGDLDLATHLTESSQGAVVASLVERGVTHVLDLRSEWSDESAWHLYAPYVVHCHAPITDSWKHYVGESWYTAVEAFVEKFWLESNDGDRLYVHCHMGINRAPSAAMLALLTVDPGRDPYDVFLQLREARPVAGLIYAEQVGGRHLRNQGESVAEFDRKMRDYWTPDRIREVNRGVGFFRSIEGSTISIA